MNITLILIVVGVIVVGAITLVIVGLRDRSGSEDALQERLADFVGRGEVATLEEIEMSQSLTDRVIIPMARRFGDVVLRITPQNALDNTARQIEIAGNPRGLEPTLFWVARFGAAIGIAALLFFVLSISSIDWPWLRKIMIVVVFTVLGFNIPQLLLNSRINRRQDGIRKALPDALDLLTICVEAGLGFDGAMAKVNEKWDNELSLSFGRVLREIQLGKLRRDALKDMSTRIDIPEMTSFVAAIVQSEQLGVSMSKVLRIQADQMRIRRRQAAEEKAQQAPIKMLFPMGVLIFPSLLIILLGPAAVQLMQSALGQMF
ncbi:MAG: type II secretion system F family protein [Anaerolineales bacterium]|nr:type II secretion system F family protein [Chloroflexota bacterium]MBL6983086.1 type II secretion system F family protein [Anaerolineales bacterium]